MAVKAKMNGKRLHAKALAWLQKNSPKEIEKDFTAYTIPSERQQSLSSRSDLYRRMIISLTQAAGTPNILRAALPNRDFNDLSKVTFDFDPQKTAAEFKRDSARLLKKIESTFKPKKKLPTGPQSVWPKFCKTMLSAAEFVCQFEDEKAFQQWANELYSNPATRAALPLIIQNEIDGCGFALACNFLIDLGFEGYGKPDVHVKKILVGLGLMPESISDYKALKIMQALALEAGITPYALDKLLYVIGSGEYFVNKVSVPSGTRRQEFIKFAAAA